MVNGILNRGKSGAGRPELAEIEPKPTGDLPIPYAGPYEERADGDRFRLCRVRASGTSAEMAPRNREPRRTPLSNPAAPKWRRRRWNEQATPIPSRKRTAGASRVTRVPVANNAAGTVSRRCREQAKKSRQRRALPPATVWSSCSRRKSSKEKSSGEKSSREKPSQRKPRFDRVGTATFPRSPAVRSTPTAALVVPDPSHSPIIGQAPVSRRRCGADETARRPA